MPNPVWPGSHDFQGSFLTGSFPWGWGGEGQLWGMGLPQNRASQEQRTQTRLDSGKPDFQKKANSNLGQEGGLGSPGEVERRRSEAP